MKGTEMIDDAWKIYHRGPVVGALGIFAMATKLEMMNTAHS